MMRPDARDGGGSISSVPISHYTMRVTVSRTERGYAGFSDVALSSRSPWIQSPENPLTPNGGRPHDHEESRAEDHDPELVIANVAAQTGLTFDKEHRAVKILFIEPVK